MYLSFQVLNEDQKNEDVAREIIDYEAKSKGITEYVVKSAKLVQQFNSTAYIWVFEIEYDDKRSFEIKCGECGKVASVKSIKGETKCKDNGIEVSCDSIGFGGELCLTIKCDCGNEINLFDE